MDIGATSRGHYLTGVCLTDSVLDASVACCDNIVQMSFSSATTCFMDRPHAKNCCFPPRRYLRGLGLLMLEAPVGICMQHASVQ